MAQYTVVSFNVSVRQHPKGFDYILLSLDLFNASGNPKKIIYQLDNDTHHTLSEIDIILNTGLNLAISDYIKIEISDFLEKNYIFITLPVLQANNKITKEKFQYTVHKL